MDVLSSDSDLEHDSCSSECSPYVSERESISSSLGRGAVASAKSKRKRDIGEVERVIQNETIDVVFWRTVVVVVIFVLGLVASLEARRVAVEDEFEDFQISFDRYSASILDPVEATARALQSSVSSFSDQLTATSLGFDQTWPFVSIPSIEVIGQNLLDQVKSAGIWYMPVVYDEQLEQWNAYTLQSDRGMSSPRIHGVGGVVEKGDSDLYMPVWQVFPRHPSAATLLNYDVSTSGDFAQSYTVASQNQTQVITPFLPGDDLNFLFPQEEIEETSDSVEPWSAFLTPIYNSFDEEQRILVGMLATFIRWQQYFENQLENEDVEGLCVVLETSCGESATWAINGTKAQYSGTFAELSKTVELTSKHRQSVSLDFFYDDPEGLQEVGVCLYTLSVHPTQAFVDGFKSKKPLFLGLGVGAAFLLLLFTIFAYDGLHQRRTNKVVVDSAITNAFVGAMFPAISRDRLLAAQAGDTAEDNRKSGVRSSKYFQSDKGHIKTFLSGEDGPVGVTSKPIADFFPEVTIMFCDITGFTAWSSVREPSQCFTLLEALFSSMDAIAKSVGVFKVETVGDCYVAATGLPDRRKDHAILMVRFARLCLIKSHAIVKGLERVLGPDTGDLNFRTGVHSGPVTAGVLRGERARFQLFGDTMNTCSRVEHAGERGRIHLSQDTADLLKRDGKGHWCKPREDLIQAKGKGKMQTYWLRMNTMSKEARSVSSSVPSSQQDQEHPNVDKLFEDIQLREEKNKRLVDWHVESFSNLLKKIVVHRKAQKMAGTAGQKPKNPSLLDQSYRGLSDMMDEIQEIIPLPEFDPVLAAKRQEQDPDSVELSSNVEEQLRDFITTIAQMYPDNPFHNFEHASHVSMSVIKLLARIVKPSDLSIEEEKSSSLAAVSEDDAMENKVAMALHDHTYGINNDPMTQFAVTFAALIHDVDHPGVPNTQMIRESPRLAVLYNDKSIAEQNSVDVAWNLLMDRGAYGDLRRAIFETQDELARFRQLVVQTVLATDIVDKELKVLRNARWETAFHSVLPVGMEQSVVAQETINRKATIVIEHLIQASDVAHTMQHWHVYRKWNERFFRECYKAYQQGRADVDPSLNWYKGEIGFFDFYIIPLAKKLKDCGVFGVSSDEYLNYAQQNRREWKECGEDVVREMLEQIQQEEESKTSGFGRRSKKPN